MPSPLEPALVALCLPPGELVPRAARVRAEGDAVLPLAPDLPGPQLEQVLDACRPKWLIDPARTTRLDGDVPVSPSTAAVITTSGTTGTPKPVELSQSALDAAARAVHTRLGAGPNDRWLCCIPPWRIGGFAILARSAHLRTEPVVHDRFDGDAVAAESDCTLVSLVPTMLARLLDAGADLSRWRAILVGGQRVAPELVDRARAAGAGVVRTYGMTETCGGVVYDGVPLDGVALKTDKESRVFIRAPMVMTGYRGLDALTQETFQDGWLRTSDRGALGDNGTLTILGRFDDTIVTGGEKVSPNEVEQILRQHPQVLDVRIEARPDPEWGERVVAFVVPVDHSAPPTLEELRELASLSMQRYKAPRELVIVRSLAD